MDRPAADQFHDRVPGLLQLQPPRDQPGAAAVPGEVERAGVAEEVGRVQQVDVQRVAFDPLAAVEQTPQIGYRPPETSIPQAASIARHALIWYADRADPADARGDVRRLVCRRPRSSASKNRGGS